ncbi:MAG: hypothetical protein HY904_11890 [Deltaproteobacteria bacterium]|nr:hypothetical protein [Deltaproteobacteria bacterium]
MLVWLRKQKTVRRRALGGWRLFILHALLFEPLRFAWAAQAPIHVINAEPAVKAGLDFLERYALGG